MVESTAKRLRGADPAHYLAEVEARHPGVLASQWIPSEPGLWSAAKFPEFVEALRELLVRAAQDFLDRLRGSGPGAVPAQRRPSVREQTLA